MPQDISDREDFYKDSSNKHRKSSGNKCFDAINHDILIKK